MEKKVLLIAITASIVFHLFWISAIKIITVPANEERVKFSKVSFLGPASQKGLALELMVNPKTASLLEKRYRQKIHNIPISVVKGPNLHYGRTGDEKNPAQPGDNALADLIEGALGSSKAEPLYSADVE